MTNWPEIIRELHPGLGWSLRDSSDLSTLEVVVGGVQRAATVQEKRYIQNNADSVLPIIEARKARRGRIKQMSREYDVDRIYEALLDDAKLEALKTRVRQIEGG